MKFKSLEDALFRSMIDLLSAEKQFRDALRDLADASEDAMLAEAFRNHRSETLEHIERLEQAFELLDRAGKPEKCKAAAGIAEETAEVIDSDGEGCARDIMLALAGRKAEQYEIVSYSNVIEWARRLGLDELADLMDETLAEERAADERLRQIAERLSTAVIA